MTPVSCPAAQTRLGPARLGRGSALLKGSLAGRGRLGRAVASRLGWSPYSCPDFTAEARGYLKPLQLVSWVKTALVGITELGFL